VQHPGVAGVVLHSPLYSGARVLQPNLRYFPGWLDIFPNHLLVPRVTAPLLVLHGTADDVSAFIVGLPVCMGSVGVAALLVLVAPCSGGVARGRAPPRLPADAPSCPPAPPTKVIHVSAGERLAALAPNAVAPLLAEGFDHQNVEACPEYLPRLKEFLSTVGAWRGAGN
jgi:hypothetical protein